jgi:hypothetical protein
MRLGYASGVPTPRKRPTLYDPAAIGRMMDDERKAAELTVQQAADIIGVGHWAWYKKADGTTPFTVLEIGTFAAHIKAPAGWPFIEMSAARFLLRELGRGSK